MIPYMAFKKSGKLVKCWLAGFSSFQTLFGTIYRKKKIKYDSSEIVSNAFIFNQHKFLLFGKEFNFQKASQLKEKPTVCRWKM